MLNLKLGKLRSDPIWAEKGIHADVLVVDPPRKGCDESFAKDNDRNEAEKGCLCEL